METIKNVVSGKEETTNAVEKGPLYMAKVLVHNVENEYGKKDAFETVKKIKEMDGAAEVEGELRYVGFETETEDSRVGSTTTDVDYEDMDIDFGDGETDGEGKDIKVYALIISRLKILENVRHGLFKDSKFILNFKREPGDTSLHPLTELPSDSKYWAYFEE